MRFYFKTERMAHWFFDQMGKIHRSMQSVEGGFLIKVNK